MEPIYTADWWERFFGWERSVQLEFVHDAVERGLGLTPRWGDEAWGDIREASDQGGMHSFPQPFDVRHMMVMLCGNYFISNPDGTVEMVDINDHHDNLFFRVEGFTQSDWDRLEKHATERLVAEYPWVWGWREHCWNTDEAAFKPKERSSLPEPPLEPHGKN
jgi:hypothetical protein